MLTMAYICIRIVSAADNL